MHYVRCLFCYLHFSQNRWMGSLCAPGQTCPWIPKMDPGIWSQGSGSQIRSDNRSNSHSLRQIHWDHRSSFAIRQEILSDPRSKTPYCGGIHRNPISDKRNSRIFYALFNRLIAFFIEILIQHALSYDFIDILPRNSVVNTWYMRGIRLNPRFP